MNLNSPRNASEANRLAVLAERAEEILKAGYTFWPDPEIETVFVCKPGDLHASYQIHRGKCDCPSFQKDGAICKHVLAYALKLEEEQYWNGRCAEHDAMLETCEVASTGCDYSRY